MARLRRREALSALDALGVRYQVVKGELSDVVWVGAGEAYGVSSMVTDTESGVASTTGGMAAAGAALAAAGALAASASWVSMTDSTFASGSGIVLKEVSSEPRLDA